VAHKKGEFIVLTAEMALRLSRNSIPIQPTRLATAISGRAIRHRKSGACVAAPSG
jgi:hypothetical protein